MACGYLVADSRSWEITINQAKAILLDSAREQAVTMSVTFTGGYRCLELFADSAADSTKRTTEETEQMLSLLLENSGFSRVFMTDADGIVAYGDQAGADYSGAPFFQSALAGNRAMEAVKEGVYTGGACIVLAVPYSEGGTVTGVLCGLYDEKDLSHVLDGSAYAGSGYSYIADTSGRVILNTAGTLYQVGQNLLAYFDNPDISFESDTAGEALRRAITDQKTAEIYYTVQGEARIISVMSFEGDGIPENDWVLCNLVAGGSLTGQIQAQRSSSLEVVSIVVVFSLLGLLLFLLLERDRKARQTQSLHIREEMLENLPCGAAIYRTNGKKLRLDYLNARYYDMVGRRGDQIQREDMMKVVHPDDVPRLYASLHTSVQYNWDGMCEARILTGDGTYKPFRVVGRFAPEGGGSYYCLYFPIEEGVFRAIMENRDTENRYRNLVDNSGGGLTITKVQDGGMANVFTSNGLLRMMHLTREEWHTLRSNDVYAKVHPEDVNRARSIFDTLREDGATESAEYRLQCHGGGYVWVNVTGRCSVENGLMYIYAVHTDITRQKESERLGIASRQRLESVMGSISCGISAYEYTEAQQHSNLLFANQSFYNLFSYTQEQYEKEVNNTLSLVCPEDLPKVLEVIETACQTHTVQTLDYRCIKRDGSIFWVAVSFRTTTLYGTDKVVLLCETVDITQRRRMEEDKASMLEQITFLNQVAGNLLSGTDTDAGVNAVLQTILDYFRGNRAYIIEYNTETEIACNTYEVCAPGTVPAKTLLQSVPKSGFSVWFQLFDRDGYIAIPDVSLLGKDRVTERHLLEIQHISSLIVVPMWVQGVLTGMVGVDDPRRNVDKFPSLQAIGDYLSVMISRRSMTRELRDNNLRMEVMMNDVPGGFAQMTILPDGSIRPEFLNDGFCNMLGMTREAAFRFYNGDAYAALHPDDRAATMALLTATIRERSTATTRLRLLTPEGNSTPVEAYYRVWRRPDGSLVLNGYYRDITDRLAKEEEYRRNMAFRDTAAGAVASFHMNLTRNVLDDGTSDDPSIRLIGEPHTIDGMILRSAGIHRPEEHTVFAARFSRERLLADMAEGRTHITQEHALYLGESRLLWVRTIANLFRNPNTGDTEGFIYATDCTEEHLLHQLMGTVVSIGYDFVVAICMRTKIYRTFIANAGITTAFQEMGDYGSETFLPQLLSIIHPEDRELVFRTLQLENLAARLEQENPSEFRFRVIENGETRNKKITYAYLDDSREYLILSRVDETETLRRMQQVLDEAKRASRAKSDFLSNMSHDIRTPMTAILNLTELSMDELDQPAKLREDLEKIRVSGQFLLGLINDILDMSRIESGRMTLNPSAYRFDDFVLYMESITVPLCRQYGVSFSWAKGDTRLAIYVDVTRFNQVFFNVLSNAIKFTPKGGSVTLSVQNNRVENGVLTCDFVIQDTGIGMSEDFQKKLFSPFERENAVSAYVGTGLGLTIAKQIITCMNGTIRIESVQGKGTTVYITLPMPLATPEQLQAGQAEKTISAPPEAAANSRLKLLVAEDHPLNREIITRILSKAGYTVVCAENGRLALEAFSASQPGDISALLLDIRMPEMDGLETARAVRALDRPDAGTVPIIAMSANAFSEDVEKSLAAGMNAHLSKPIEPKKLFDALAALLQDKEAQK